MLTRITAMLGHLQNNVGSLSNKVEQFGNVLLDQQDRQQTFEIMTKQAIHDNFEDIEHIYNFIKQ